MKWLWAGDAGCDSGFARCTHETLKGVLKAGHEVAVLGINYKGDGHKYPYQIYPAWTPGGDLFGIRRLKEVLHHEQPDVMVIQNDPWNVPHYLAKLKEWTGKMPFLVGAIAIDGKNCMSKPLNFLDHTIFWTEFAQNEARLAGFNRSSSVVPLGVDLNIFSPGDRDLAWQRLNLPDITRNGFFFLNVNRNQHRKHLDLTIYAFAKFLERWRREKIATDPWPYLYMHVCPTGDDVVNLDQLAGYWGLQGHFILAEPGVWNKSSEADLVATYRMAHCMLTTTQGEGWGLPTMEGMACGVPQIVPDWSALGEWTEHAAFKIPISQLAVTPGYVNVIGGLPDHDKLVETMWQLYREPELRDIAVHRGTKLVAQDKYRWENIGAKFEADVSRTYEQRGSRT